MVLCLEKPPRRFLRCWLSFSHLSMFFILLLFFSLLFNIIPHPSVDYCWGFYTPFCTFSPAHRRVSCDTFICSTILFLPRVLRPWVGTFHQQAFFTLRSFLTFLAQPAFIKASLEVGSFSLKFTGLHTDLQNIDPAHLFVWFTVICNLYTS